MQSTVKIDHTRAKKELERLLHNSVELREFHKKITEKIESAFLYDDIEYDIIPIIYHQVYNTITSKEKSTDKCLKILVILEGMEMASKKHSDLTVQHIYNLMKNIGSFDEEIYKYLDLMYDLKKMEDEEEVGSSEDEEEP